MSKFFFLVLCGVFLLGCSSVKTPTPTVFPSPIATPETITPEASIPASEDVLSSYNSFVSPESASYKVVYSVYATYGTRVLSQPDSNLTAYRKGLRFRSDFERASAFVGVGSGDMNYTVVCKTGLIDNERVCGSFQFNSVGLAPLFLFPSISQSIIDEAETRQIYLKVEKTSDEIILSRPSTCFKLTKDSVSQNAKETKIGCFDKKTGVPLKLEYYLSVGQYRENDTSFKLTASSIFDRVSESDLVVPVS